MKKNICGIYKISNDINDKIYIGQSVNIAGRWIAHRYAGRNFKNTREKSKIHKAMNELGLDHFIFEIVEECEIEKLDERETYWIEYFNSYYNGYNSTKGGNSTRGEQNGRAILTESQVFEIRQMYANHIRLKDAYEFYKNKISKCGFMKIWHYETWLYIMPEVYTEENRLWHATQAKANINGNKKQGYNNKARACSNEEIVEMRNLRNKGLSYAKIAKKLGRSQGVVRKYCLFQESKIPNGGIQINNVETGLVFQSIREAAKWCGCSKDTLGKHRNDGIAVGKVPSTGEPAHWELI